jgi:hypothetical protein
LCLGQPISTARAKEKFGDASLGLKRIGKSSAVDDFCCSRLESTYCCGCLRFLRVRILLGIYSGEFSVLLTSSPGEISSKLQPGRFSLDGNFLSTSQFRQFSVVKLVQFWDGGLRSPPITAFGLSDCRTIRRWLV